MDLHRASRVVFVPDLVARVMVFFEWWKATCARPSIQERSMVLVSYEVVDSR